MQRVAMGRAIVRNPAIFLFDEPLSNLDAKLRGKVRGEIKALHGRLGTTTVYVTHDQVEAMTLANRLVVMRDGHVEQIGTPLALYDRPETPFVAGFIGAPAMNLLTGLVDGSRLRLPSGIALAIPPMPVAGEVMLGIRPEHLTVAAGGWPFRVTMVEPMGNETHLTGDIGGVEAVVTVKTRDLPASGTLIAVKPDLSQLHLFQNDGRIEMPDLHTAETNRGMP